MAKPQWHVAPTRLCAGLAYWLGAGWQEVIIAGFLGFFIDGDHMSLRRWRNIREGHPKDYVPGWVDYFHTWYAAAIFIICGAFTGWWFALASYIIHILIDAGNSENLVSHEAPLPEYLYRFYPSWLTYRSGL